MSQWSTMSVLLKNSESLMFGWLVVLRIYVASAVFQPYRDLEAGDNQSLKIQVTRPGIEPRSSCSASQELNHSATTAPSESLKFLFLIPNNFFPLLAFFWPNHWGYMILLVLNKCMLCSLTTKQETTKDSMARLNSKFRNLRLAKVNQNVDNRWTDWQMASSIHKP